MWPARETSAGTAPGTGGGISIERAGPVSITQHWTVNHKAVRAPVGSYLAQVRRIAPPVLEGREAELAELAAFCLEPDRGPYVWWQAAPWAGKSALLSSFVLSPPPQVTTGQVKLASFFITARLASQDTRQAFIDAMLEQLAALAGENVPAVLPDTSWEWYLLALMERAAVSCRQVGGRLVLVVDGLDEDRGVTTGPDAHSIAGLLPAAPPAGMRVIVAGRPNPPVPGDVPDWHPLRDPAVIRLLADSAHARDIERLSNQELKRLLNGSTAERDVLGLLTAARGGLSARDLAGLAQIAVWDAEEILHTAAGRTFARRPARWAPAAAPEVYLLGHEELQAAAARYLDGSGLLPGYRDRLHAWAEASRDGGWPADTPEYLLGGYYQLLTDPDDLPRMTACGLDRVRHDRMLTLTGGDAAALAEVRTALDVIAAQDDPDLASALALACHRDQLTDRNAGIPDDLPAIWAVLGEVTRAEALAASITHLDGRVRALAAVAGALAQAGHQQAAAVAGQAAAVARTITNWHQREDALVVAAGALARTGQYEQVEGILGLIRSPHARMDALAPVAVALVQAGDYRQAETVARSIPWPPTQGLVAVAVALVRAGQYEQAEAMVRSLPDAQALALSALARALAQAGQQEQAAAMAAWAETTARSITIPFVQALALAAVTQALVLTGQHPRAVAAARQAETLALSITGPDPDSGSRVMIAVAVALARTGQYQQAVTMARSITCPRPRAQVREQAEALAAVAVALVEAGQFEGAESLMRSIAGSDMQPDALTEVPAALARAGQYERAETLARLFTRPDMQSKALSALAVGLAEAGQYQQAEIVARSISGWNWQRSALKALTAVARTLAQAGEQRQAASVAEHAEAMARSITLPNVLLEPPVTAVAALVQAGQSWQAESLARWLDRPDLRAEALSAVAVGLVKSGQYPQAETVARSITSPSSLVAVAVSLVRAGQYQQAKAMANWITEPNWLARSLVAVAGAFAQAGEREQAAATAAQAESVARSIAEPGTQVSVLTEVAVAFAQAGRYQQAEALARSISEPEARARALAAVAGALAQAGEREQAAATAAQAETAARTIAEVGAQVKVLTEVAVAFAQAGRYQEAENLARSITAGQAGASAPARTRVLSAVAGALVQSGQYQQAEALITLVADVRAVAGVAGMLAQAEQYDRAALVAAQAEALARSTTSPHSSMRGQSLAAVAAALAQAKQYRQAVAAARSIINADSRAQALVAVSQALAKAGDTRSASRLAAAACTAGPWTIAASAVLLLDTDAFSVLSRIIGIT